jgi:hypothetical protein
MAYIKKRERTNPVFDSETYHTTTATTLQTVVNLTGAGQGQIAIRNIYNSATYSYAMIKVTVDSNVVINDRDIVHQHATYNRNVEATLEFEWKTNFKFEIRNDITSGNIQTVVSYLNA